MQLIKHTQIKSDTIQYDFTVINAFGAYWAVGFYSNSTLGKPYGELNAAIDYYEKQISETFKHASKTQLNVEIKTIK